MKIYMLDSECEIDGKYLTVYTMVRSTSMQEAILETVELINNYIDRIYVINTTLTAILTSCNESALGVLGEYWQQ